MKKLSLFLIFAVSGCGNPSDCIIITDSEKSRVFRVVLESTYGDYPVDKRSSLDAVTHWLSSCELVEGVRFIPIPSRDAALLLYDDSGSVFKKILVSLPGEYVIAEVEGAKLYLDGYPVIPEFSKLMLKLDEGSVIPGPVK